MEKSLCEHLIHTAMEELSQRLPEKTVQRQSSVSKLPNKIAACIGMRRVGKTVLMYQDIQALLTRLNKNYISPTIAGVNSSFPMV